MAAAGAAPGDALTQREERLRLCAHPLRLQTRMTLCIECLVEDRAARHARARRVTPSSRAPVRSAAPLQVCATACRRQLPRPVRVLRIRAPAMHRPRRRAAATSAATAAIPAVDSDLALLRDPGDELGSGGFLLRPLGAVRCEGHPPRRALLAADSRRVTRAARATVRATINRQSRQQSQAQADRCCTHSSQQTLLMVSAIDARYAEQCSGPTGGGGGMLARGRSYRRHPGDATVSAWKEAESTSDRPQF